MSRLALQGLFTGLIALQFAIVALHDLVDIPGWMHGGQVRAVVGRGKLWLITLVNSLFPGIAVALTIYFWNRPTPWFALGYWVVHAGVTSSLVQVSPMPTSRRILLPEADR
jgi:hypothetical protein